MDFLPNQTKNNIKTNKHDHGDVCQVRQLYLVLCSSFLIPPSLLNAERGAVLYLPHAIGVTGLGMDRQEADNSRQTDNKKPQPVTSHNTFQMSNYLFYLQFIKNVKN